VSCWWHVWELILGLFSATPTLTWCEEYKSKNIKRGKVVSVHSRKACVAFTGTAPVTVYLITIWRSIASLITCCFTPGEGNWRLGGSQTFWRKVNSAFCWDTNPPDHPACSLLYWICYSNSSNEEMSVSKLTPYRTCWVCWRQWCALYIGQTADKPFS
jgi:hypothetical protein